MSNYLNFIKKYILEIAFLILGCGAAGSLKGASVESWLRAEVTYTTPTAEEAGVTRPYMEGLFRLAADENMWYNLRYAFVWALVGTVVVLILSVLVYAVVSRWHSQSAQVDT